MNEQLNNANQTEQEVLVQEQQNDVNNTERVCPNCKNPVLQEQEFCTICGTSVKAEKPQSYYCVNCKLEVPFGTKFCPKCGKEVKPVEAVKKEAKSYNKKLFAVSGIIISVVAIVAVALIVWFYTRAIPVESIELSEYTLELKEEETKNISCTVYPEDATDKTVTWTSSNEAVATVNSYGMITAVKEGTCVITAQSGQHSKTVNVTVKIKGPNFSELYNTIDSDVKYGWTLGSDGSYLKADTNVYDLDDYSNLSIWYSIKDMNENLGLPDSFNNEVTETTWSMGRQKKVFKSIGIEVTWTYHPDKGIEISYSHLTED